MAGASLDAFNAAPDSERLTGTGGVDEHQRSMDAKNAERIYKREAKVTKNRTGQNLNSLPTPDTQYGGGSAIPVDAAGTAPGQTQPTNMFNEPVARAQPLWWWVVV